jgi:hypothetical protein
LSRKQKAKRRLAQSRRRGTLKAKIRLVETEQDLIRREFQYHDAQYLSEMLGLYRDADETQRVELERIYHEATGISLQGEYTAHIIASLQSQPRGVCDRS